MDSVAIERKLKQLKYQELFLDYFAVGLFVISWVGSIFLMWAIREGNIPESKSVSTFVPMMSNDLVFVLLILFVGYVEAFCLKVLFDFFSRNFVKSYFIEDCGDTIKLHGSIRLLSTDKAKQDLIGGRQGYRVVVDKAYEKYGCTMAAVKI